MGMQVLKAAAPAANAPAAPFAAGASAAPPAATRHSVAAQQHSVEKFGECFRLWGGPGLGKC